MKIQFFLFIILLAWPSSLKSDDDRSAVEDVFNRYGGPPLYRYYQYFSPDNSSKYEKMIRNQPDANEYWGDRYLQNSAPDPLEEKRINRELMDLHNDSSNQPTKNEDY